ncbi:MAG: hypothetical protein ABI658_19320 [Acidimicrobiales bacterium]
MGKAIDQVADPLSPLVGMVSDRDGAILEVFVSVADSAVAAALVASMDGDSFVVVTEPTWSAVLVTDDRSRDDCLARAATIEVVAPRPESAASAFDNVLRGRSHGVVLSDDLGAVVHTLRGHRSNGVVFSTRVVELARRVPRSQHASLPALSRYLD